MEGLWGLQQKQKLQVVHLQQHACDLASQWGAGIVDEGVETLPCVGQSESSCTRLPQSPAPRSGGSHGVKQ